MPGNPTPSDRGRITGSSFTTVEGNTGNPNGGSDGVYIKSIATNSSYDVAFIRVR